MKNILLAVLTMICAALLYKHFTQEEKPCVQEEAVAVAAPAPVEEIMPVKLDAPGVIAVAEVEGISMSTPLEEVDGLLEQAGYTCQKNDNKTTTADSAMHVVDWNCTHNQMDKTRMAIRGKGGELVSINRQGPMSMAQAEAIISHIDDLKARMSSRESMMFDQTATRTNFILNHKGEAGTQQLQYRLQIFTKQNDRGEEEQSATLRSVMNR